MDETTIDIDGMAADAIAGNILSAIDVSPERIVSFSVQSTVANDDGSGTAFELSATGTDAGTISQQLLSSFNWDNFTASSITVRAEIRDDSEDPNETEGSSPASGAGDSNRGGQPRDGGYSWSVHDEPDVDEPEPVKADSRSYRVLYHLTQEYDDEPLSSRELSGRLQAKGESFNASQTTAVLSRLFVRKALVNREKSKDSGGASFRYWPTEYARELVDDYGEPE